MSQIYRAIITSRFKTQNLIHFYNSVGDSGSPTTPDKNNIYLSFGRKEPWAENEDDQGFAPPYPVDSSDGVVDVWTHMFGVVKVKKEYFDAVIPRIDWGDTRYNPNNNKFEIGDIVVLNSAQINLTHPGRGMMVYRCVDVPDQGDCSITSIDNKLECLRVGGKWEPEAPSSYRPDTTGDAIEMLDGYVWEYLYTIPPDVSITRVTNEYIVIPFPEDIKEDPERWGMKDILQTDPDRHDLIYRVKCSTLKFKSYLDSLYFPEYSLPGNNKFRQMSLLINPLEKKPKQDSPDVVANKDHYKKDDLDLQTGEIIYIENRQPIIRQQDQVEEVSIVFAF